jgi:Archaeal TRASH domain
MIAVVLLGFSLGADPVAAPSAREALKPFNLFVGSWKATGIPDQPGKPKEFWSEKIAWEWQFAKSDATAERKNDVWLVGTIEKGKFYSKFELRPLLENQQFELKATALDKSTQTFVGALAKGQGQEQVLTVDRTDGGKSERLVFTLLHANRYLYRLDTKPSAAASFTRQYQVGVTKEGEEFANVPKGPECIVSGGSGTIRVTHKGQTYYVCCSGCRDEFKENPEKYVREFEAKKKKK